MSIIGIMRELKERGIPSPTGKATWSRRAIDTLLGNEKYRGGSTATTALMSYDSHYTQRTKYLYADHHKPVIDNDTFISVAEEKQKRSNIEYDEHGAHRKETRYAAKIVVKDPEEQH